MHAPALLARERLAGVQYRALRAIERCRTAALGGEIHRCDHCGETHYVYHSCRNRHCPKCQTLAKERWLAARRAELLPVPYFHLVFTLPHELNPLAQGNPRALYVMLFAAASATLLEFGANPRWLGGEIAATLVLHTWSQTLTQHLHVHALVAGGALGADGQWVAPRRGFLFPVKALSKLFRGKFLAALSRAFAQDRLRFGGSTTALAEPSARRGLLATLRAKPWSSTPSTPSAAPNRSSTTSAATCSAWRSPMSGCSTSMRAAFASPGATGRKATAEGPCACPRASSSSASCFMCCRKASCASATTACSPTATSATASPRRVPRSTPPPQLLSPSNLMVDGVSDGGLQVAPVAGRFGKRYAVQARTRGRRVRLIQGRLVNLPPIAVPRPRAVLPVRVVRGRDRDRVLRGLAKAVLGRCRAANATHTRAPQAGILFDKFHIMRHLGEALDKVRKAEYARVSGRDRRFIKGQKYTLVTGHAIIPSYGKRIFPTPFSWRWLMFVESEVGSVTIAPQVEQPGEQEMVH